MTTKLHHTAGSAWTSAKAAKVLEGLRKDGTLLAGCKAARCARTVVWRRRHTDPEFAKAYDEAAEEGHGKLLERYEAEADRRALTGVKRKKFHHGQPIMDGTKQYEEREYSDNLLMFRAKALAPEKYRERTDLTTKGEQIPAAVIYMPAKQPVPE